MTISEHELLQFRRVNRLLGHVQGGMTVKSTGPLAAALGRLGCFPYTKIPCDLFNIDCAISIAGKSAGTFKEPDVNLILQESTASSFGRGETTVLDPTYRNGKEILAQNIDLENKYFSRMSEADISAAMFLGKPVKVKLYKLAVYEEGGHFDWHMDSTHSDQHHATLLLALNTSWEGGDFKLRRNGVETVVDMHPKADRGDSINLQAVAFYTDTEHKVEPVAKGTRIVLQYDVEVVGWKAKLASAVNEKGDNVKDKDDNAKDKDDNAKDKEDESGDEEDEDNCTDKDEEDESGDEEDEHNDKDEEDEDNDKDELFDHMEHISKRRRYQESPGSLTADKEIVTKVTDIIASLLADGKEEVAFAMQHLYRKNSILPEFLKGADAQLHRALVSSFDVTLRPVVLHMTTDYDGSPGPYMAVQWKDSSDSNLESSSESESEIESDDDEDHSGAQPLVFHTPVLSAIKQISYKEYAEHTGNEAQPGERKYFGGGMFVRQKKKQEHS